MKSLLRARPLRALSVAMVAMATLLTGCTMPVLDPKGLIGVQEKELIITATLLMLIVVIPVIVLCLWFAWHYRESNEQATYTPNWSYSHRIEAVVWAIPCAIILVLGVITWRTTHSLDPFKPLEAAGGAKPLEIEVVALDWKWLFIYPEQHIASVNEIAIPTDVPVKFKITSDSVMNVFFIPQLGTQVYAMAGMQTQVSLVANSAGVYDGLSANFSGDGFADMRFAAHAASREDFDAWVAKARASGARLDADSYRELSKPSEKNPVQYFSTVEPTLYASVLDKSMDKTTGLALANKICLPGVVAKASE
jgi:cytochrome o ubiquinol oxidase subunit 2